MVGRPHAYAVLAACFMILAGHVAVQIDINAVPVATDLNAIALGTGPVPGAPSPEIWSGKRGARSVRNVVNATVTAVLPDPARATGVAMVVALGGTFMTLAWNYEGMQTARVLVDHGIAAFVVKYRLYPTPRDWPGFGKAMDTMMTDWVEELGKPLRIVTPTYAVENGIAALKLVRAGDARWHVDPSRVGMLYPPTESVKVPTDAPPAFVAMATDDPLFGRAGYGLIES